MKKIKELEKRIEVLERNCSDYIESKFTNIILAIPAFFLYGTYYLILGMIQAIANPFIIFFMRFNGINITKETHPSMGFESLYKLFKEK